MVTMKSLGHTEGDVRFKKHCDTFITEQDIENIGKLLHFKLPYLV